MFVAQVSLGEVIPGPKPSVYCSSSGSCCVSSNGSPCCLIDQPAASEALSVDGGSSTLSGGTCTLQSGYSCGGATNCCVNGMCRTTDSKCCDDAGGHGPVAGVSCGGSIGLCCNGTSSGFTEAACCLGTWKGVGYTCNLTLDANGDGIPDEDPDGDGICDACDNCPDDNNPGQADFDNDDVGDYCDWCPATADSTNAESDGDTFGDVCDNCPFDYNPGQEDSDQCAYGDNHGLPCDSDEDCPGGFCDHDGVGDLCDNCPDLLNSSQDDSDLACSGGDNAGMSCSSGVDCPGGTCTGDGIGDACDDCPLDNPNDSDGDGVCDSDDNCPNTPNADQANCDAADGDTLGDACDPDIDNDTIPNEADTCDYTPLGLRYYVFGTNHPLAGTVRQDVDGDCDVDVNDASSVNQFSGYSGGPGCADGSPSQEWCSCP